MVGCPQGPLEAGGADLEGVVPGDRVVVVEGVRDGAGDGGDGVDVRTALTVDEDLQAAAVEGDVVEVEPGVLEDRLDERTDTVDGAHLGFTSSPGA